MKKNNEIYLRQELEQISSTKLRDMLHTEIAKKPFDGDRIRMILKVLEAREEDLSAEISEREEAVWEQFKQDCAEDRQRLAAERAAPKRKWVAGLAAAAAVVCLLVFAVPPASGTDNIFDAIATLSEKAVSYFSQTDPEDAYIFQTDDPGLQQIYDAVVEMGITDPIVPMWCPEGYELIEIKTTSTASRTKVYARLLNGENKIVFTIELLGMEGPNSYFKDNVEPEILEVNGVAYHITSNDGAWTATWTTEKTICSLSVDGERDTLEEMIWSIY